MTPSDIAFAQSCVRALNIVAQAAKEWLRNKTIELAPKQTQDSQQPPRE
jgi:hypothetical protein